MRTPYVFIVTISIDNEFVYLMFFEYFMQRLPYTELRRNLLFFLFAQTKDLRQFTVLQNKKHINPYNLYSFTL